MLGAKFSASVPLMNGSFHVRISMQSSIRFFLHMFILLALVFGGCSSEDMTPVQTTGDEIVQFLQENPEENYSSDGAESEEADEDSDEDNVGE